MYRKTCWKGPTDVSLASILIPFAWRLSSLILFLCGVFGDRLPGAVHDVVAHREIGDVVQLLKKEAVGDAGTDVAGQVEILVDERNRHDQRDDEPHAGHAAPTCLGRPAPAFRLRFLGFGPRLLTGIGRLQ